MQALPPCLGWLLTIAAATLSLSRTGNGARWRGVAWRLLLVGAVVAFRWPQLIATNEFNPDESQSLAGAITLLHDPRFWISVDGATAGPLHFLVQVPAALLPGTAAYFGERLLALGLVVAAIFAVASLVRDPARPIIDALCTIPAAVAFAATPFADFQYLSTETLPVFLIAVALALGFPRQHDDHTPPLRAIGIGLLLGAVPLAKLQAAPIALLIGVIIALDWIRLKIRHVVPLCAAALVPALIAALYLTLVDGWKNALVPYVFNNLNYVGVSKWPIWDLVRIYAVAIVGDGYLCAFVVVGLGVIAIGLVRLSQAGPRLRRLWVIATLWLATAGACTLLPHRPFIHYLNLVAAPWLLLVGCALTTLETALYTTGQRRRTGFVLLALWLAPVAALHCFRYNGAPALTAYYRANDADNAAIYAAIRDYQRPGDSLAVWGQRTAVYVYGHFRQATPQAHSETQIAPGPWQGYFLETYARAFARNRPAFFVDAVGPGNFVFKDRTLAHEIFPALRQLVAADYTLLAEIAGTRIYVRNDRLHATGDPTASIRS